MEDGGEDNGIHNVEGGEIEPILFQTVVSLAATWYQYTCFEFKAPINS